METEEYKGYTIKIEHDDYPDNPRDWDNAGEMVCWHRRYNLGDEEPVPWYVGIIGIIWGMNNRARTLRNGCVARSWNSWIIQTWIVIG